MFTSAESMTYFDTKKKQYLRFDKFFVPHMSVYVDLL